MRKEFEGKTALVTGGARNIGLAIGKELASQGASIALLDICQDLETIPYRLSSSRDLERAVEEVTAFGTQAIGIPCDVRDEERVKASIESVVEAFGHIDILVNNAGVISLSAIEEISERAWNEIVDVCLKGTFLCCKHVVPLMIKAHYGKIVNISSIAGLRGLGLSVHYCAAKHGVIGLTKALSMELSDHNINVTAICPGTVESVSLDGLASQIGLDQDIYPFFSKGHLFQDRRITPEDIARAVRWLVSEDSRCMTGAIITVDSGWTARG